MSQNSTNITVGFTRDFIKADGEVDFHDESYQALLDHPAIDLVIMDEAAPTNITPSHVQRFDALMMKRSPLRAPSLEGGEVRLKLVARNGVGYDHLDIPACTEAGVMVAITPQGVRRPVASSNVALMLALAHRLFERDTRTRDAAWKMRTMNPGIGLEGRTLGIIGLGNIGQEILHLMKPWGMKHIAVAPGHSADEYKGLDVTLVDLDSALAQSDFLLLCCPLNDRTRHMIGERELRLMKPDAYLINTARGEIIEEVQLIRALKENWIAGAGIEVFDNEPPKPDNGLFQLDNVILGSHNWAHSDDMIRLGNSGVTQAIIDLAEGRVPENLVNPEATGHAKLKNYFG